MQKRAEKRTEYRKEISRDRQKKFYLVRFFMLIFSVLFFLCLKLSQVDPVLAEPDTEAEIRSRIFTGNVLVKDIMDHVEVSEQDHLLPIDASETDVFTAFMENTVPELTVLLTEDPAARVYILLAPETDNEAEVCDIHASEQACLNTIRKLTETFPDAEICTVLTPYRYAADEENFLIADWNEMLQNSSISGTLDLNGYFTESDLTAAKTGTFAPLNALIAYEWLLHEAGEGETSLKYADHTMYAFQDGLYVSDYTGMWRYAKDDSWYLCHDGEVVFGYNGYYPIGDTEYYILNSKLRPGYDSPEKPAEPEPEPVPEPEPEPVPVPLEPASNEVQDLHAVHAVYLTFDDGPSSTTTPYVLDVLDRYGVKACFFVTYQPGNEWLYREIVNRGHSIGVHTASHQYETIYASFDNWLADFNQVYTYIQQVTGVTPVLYRFPGGSNTRYPSDEVRQQIKDYVHSIGCEYYDWNVTTDGGDPTLSQEVLAQNVFGDIDNRTLPVILCHDGLGFENTVQVLPQVISTLQAKGYQFRRLEPGVPVIQQGSHWDYN